MAIPDTIEDRLDEWLADRDLAAVWFARPNSFAWLTGGDDVIDRSADVGIAAAGYDGDGLTVVTNNIEAGRLEDEELPADASVIADDWYERGLAESVAAHSPAPAAADFDVPGFEAVDATGLRQPLTERDVERYRSLGEETAAVLEGVLREATDDDTEREVAARIRKRLFDRAIESPVVLVGGGERAPEYRHYTVSDAPLGSYALASVTTGRDGLRASCTRTVAFDPPEWLEARTHAAMRVETTALAATRAVGREGGTAGDVFEAIQDAYAEVGHPEEWELHHQGGAAGYASREWIATPGADDPVELPMAYAWNPTVQGAKSEDTFLVTADGFENLTSTGDWPSERAAAVGYDATLERHGALER